VSSAQGWKELIERSPSPASASSKHSQPQYWFGTHGVYLGLADLTAIAYDQVVAGTLGYTVAVQHTYQRRFNRRDLGDALAGCHWYIISARPAVRIIPGSVGVGEGILTAAFRESGVGGGAGSVSVHGAAYADDDRDATFRIHDDGSYFSFQFPGAHLHGDSWSLAAFLSGGGPALARHEILYIGKAYGDGTRTAEQRTAQHEKLQVIYEDFHGQGMDIFLTPLRLLKSTWSTDDHIDDLEPGINLDEYKRVFAAEADTVPAISVDLIDRTQSHFTFRTGLQCQPPQVEGARADRAYAQHALGRVPAAECASRHQWRTRAVLHGDPA
jgi:hypothetical protein